MRSDPGAGTDRAIFTSTVIPTIGRPDLQRAVESVLLQAPPRSFEVVVVNDTGAPLPPGEWQSDPRVRILQTDRKERCVARNTGAAASRGVYLHFLDDDDWLLPGGLRGLHEAALETPGGFIYGATRLFDRRGAHLLDLEHGLAGNVAVQVMCGEWIPLQSALIDKDLFFELGGFHAWQAGAEDIDLARRAAVSTDFRYLPQLISVVVMGESGSTTEHDRQRERSRRGRELILDQKETFRRMSDSADAPHRRGGLARVYLTSALWNLGRGRLAKALIRLFHGLAAILSSGRHLLRTGFWRAIARPYRSVTFSRGAANFSGAAG
ncbi:MAG TPA: glycosyltransferase family A protein [Anaerolineales bacterium]|nr:glycosyltransferase family A protein [Anaerolineales bacterium]